MVVCISLWGLPLIFIFRLTLPLADACLRNKADGPLAIVASHLILVPVL